MHIRPVLLTYSLTKAQYQEFVHPDSPSFTCMCVSKFPSVHYLYHPFPLYVQPESATIISAGMRKDVDGNDIHAHGGGIYTENGTYYWFGTTQKILPGDLSDGINVYKSTDLQHWEFGGKVFKNTRYYGGPSFHLSHFSFMFLSFA